MDEIFGTPYGVVDRVGLELKSFRRERGLVKDGGEGEVEGKGGVRVDGEQIVKAEEV